MASNRHKTVCAGCRARKKKCDGGQPTCSACAKRNIYCRYVSRPGPMSAGIPWQAFDSASDPVEWSLPGSGFVLGPGSGAGPGDALFPGLDRVSQPAALSIEPWDTMMVESFTASSPPFPFPLQHQSSFGLLPDNGLVPSLSDGSETVNLGPEPSLLPPHHRLVELTDIFFSRVQWYLPLFHQQSFSEAVSSGEVASRCPLLLYSIIALTARAHPDAEMRKQQPAWFSMAKTLYESSRHVPEPALDTLQAAVCITMQALTIGEHHTAMFVLSRAWRQAVTLGFHQLDSASQTARPGLTLPVTSDWREMEQRRRIVWSLYILDRGMYFPAGLTHTIDDRQLRLRLPVDELTFQESEMPPTQSDIPQFSSDPKRFVRQIQRLVRIASTGTFRYLVFAYFLLGRITEHMFSPDYDLEDEQTQSERALLEDVLAQSRLMLPRSAMDLAAANHADFAHVIWLRVMMDVNTIFLYHRPSSDIHSSSLEAEPEVDTSQEADHWQCCLAAARSTALLIREASAISTDLIMNPLIAAPIFTCARILATEYVLLSPYLQNGGAEKPQGRTPLRTSLETMLLIFNRLDETFGGILHKFRVGLLYHLGMDLATIKSVKAGGSRGLLLSCAHWPTDKDVEGVDGIPD